MKRFLALFLMAIMLVTSLPISGLTDVAYAATQYHQETKKMPGFDSLSEDFVLNTYDASLKKYKAIRVNLKQLVSDAVLAGKAIKNTKGMYLCPRILAEYGLAVYQVEGTFLNTRGFGDTSINKDSVGFTYPEYRYLGYDMNGNAVTNDLRKNDTGYANPNDLKTKNWIKADIERDSWNEVSRVNTDKVFQTPFVSDDGTGTANPGNNTLANILNPTLQKNHNFNYTQAGSMSESQLDTAKQYLNVNAAPSIATKGSVVAIHKKDDRVYYNTFILDKLALDFVPKLTITAYTDAACTNAITSYVFGETEEEKTIYVKLSTDIAMDSIGLKGKERDFIRGVTNTFVPLNSSKRTAITSSINMADVANVYPLKITRNDREVQLNGKAEIEPTTDVANITKRLTAKTVLKVSALQPQLKPDEIRADFAIMRNIQDVTDGQFTYEGMTLSKPIVLDLLDRSEAEGNTKIVSYKWSAMNRISGTYEQFSTIKLPTFSFGSSDESKYFNADKELHFRLEITSDKGKTASMIHRTKVLFEEPEEPDPTEDPKTIKAYINAPEKVKAGTEANLSAYAMVTGGTVDRFEFLLDESVKGLGGFFGSKEVTFLKYDADVISGVAAYADFNDVAENYDSTKVLHPLEGVFNTKGTFKVNRTVEINSEGSFGTTYYPIDKVTWEIRPLEGQSFDSMKYHTSNVGEKIFVDFKAEGLYEIKMTIHSTCTYPGEGHRTATKTITGQLKIYPDLPPVAKVSVPSRVIRDPAHYRMADYIVADLSYSPDGDEIGLKRFYVRRDTDNDKSLEDEKWELIYEGLNDNVFYESPLVGLYEYKIEVEETNESVNSPFWNPVTDTRRDNTDSQPLTEKTTEIVNVAPITSSLADKRSVDIVIATDYEGAKLSQLKTEVDMMIKELYEIGINLKVSFVNARKKIGTQKVPIYKYVRYGTVSYTENRDYVYRGYGAQDMQEQYKRVFKIPWETRYAREDEYLPNYGYIATSYSVSEYVYDSEWSFYKYIQKRYTLNAPYDPAIRSKVFYNNYTLSYLRNYDLTPMMVYNASLDDFKFEVSGQFEKEEMTSSASLDLYGIDLAQVKAVNFRQGADRIMLFANDSSSSTLNVDENFRQWALTNGIEVNATGASNIKDQLGYGKFVGTQLHFKYNPEGSMSENEYPLQPSYLNAVVLTSELGANYKVDFSYSNISVGYPVITKETTDTSRGVKVQFANTPQSVKNAVKDQLPDLYPMSPVASGFSVSLEQGQFIEGEGKDFDYADLKLAPYWPYATSYEVIKYEIDGSKSLIKKTKAGSSTLLTNVTGIHTYERSYYREYVFEGIKNGVKTYFKAIKTKSYTPMTTEWGEQEILNSSFPGWSYTYRYAVGSVHVANNQVSESFFNAMPKLVATEEDSIKRLRLIQHSNATYAFERVAFHSEQVTELEKTRQIQYTQDVTYQYGPAKRTRIIEYGAVQNYDIGQLSEAYVIGEKMGIPLLLSADRKSLFTFVYRDELYASSGKPYKQVIASLGNPIRNAVFVPDLAYPYMHMATVVSETGEAFLWFQNGSTFSPRVLAAESRTLDTPNPVPKTVADLLNTTTTGKYYSAFTSFKEGVKNVYNQLDYKTRLTRLLGETVTLDVIYSDYENDPLYESYVLVGHDPTVLENDIGTDLNNGKTVPKWDGVLNKTGLYSIKPKVRDNPNEDDRFDDYRLWNKDDMTIEVLSHRRPIAKMDADSSNTSPMYLVGRDAQSYDLDHESMANRGIVQVEWSYKRLSEDAWQKVIGPLGTQLKANAQMGETYLVAYRVKDVEGEWSYPVMKTIVPKIEMKLKAELKPENPLHKFTAFQTGNNVVFSKLWTSYPYEHNVSIQMYDGSTPILSQVLLTKANGNVAKENAPERDWKDVTFNIPKMVNGVKLANKTYRFVVTAYDPSDAAMTAAATFYVTTVSNSPPKVAITMSTPSTLYEGDAHFISLEVSDPDLDLVDLDIYYRIEGEAEQRYAHYKQLKSGTVVTTKPLILPNALAIHWRAVVVDPSQSQAEAKRSNPIHAFGIESLEVKGSWHHWRGQVNGLGKQMTNEPHRFLSLENLTFSLKVRGTVESAYLDLEAPLKAMTFNSKNGKTIHYKDLIGKTVAFPLFFSRNTSNLFKLEYILPLAPSTVDSNDKRLRPPYAITIVIENEDRVRTYTFDAASGGPFIDITGNTFDHVYNQPSGGGE